MYGTAIAVHVVALKLNSIFVEQGRRLSCSGLLSVSKVTDSVYTDLSINQSDPRAVSKFPGRMASTVSEGSESQNIRACSELVSDGASADLTDSHSYSRVEGNKQKAEERKEENIGRPTCSYCNRSFAENSGLRRHLLVHSSQKPHTCDVCGASFKLSYNLTVHKRKHTDERPYSCSTCERTFTQSSAYKEHLRIHSGQQPFSCDICQASFTRNYSLTIHKRVHKSDHPYKCDECPGAFLDSSSLKRHIRRHTGEKPYTCDVCGKSFSQSQTLKIHHRNHDRASTSKTTSATAETRTPQQARKLNPD